MAVKTEKPERTAKTRQTEKAETAENAKQAGKAERTAKAKRTEKPAETAKATETAHEEQDLTREDIIGRYLEIYRRCMTDDPKSFDARGAAHALEQISKLLGLTVSAKDTDGNEIVLTLSEEADAFGQ